MIEAIKELGEYVLEEDPAFLPVKHKEILNVKEPKIAKIIFDLDKRILELDADYISDEKNEKKFLWVGNAPGNKPQLRLTTDNPKYILGGKGHQWVIGEILKKIEDEGLFKDEDVKNLYEVLGEVNEKFFSNKENWPSKLEGLLKEKGLKNKELALYTVSVKRNDEIMDLAETNGYRKLLYYVLYESGFKRVGRCHICGEEKEVLADPSYPEGTLLKIYNIDKIGFLSNITKSTDSMLKTHVICVECKRKLVSGLNLVERHLRSRIGDIRVLIVPKLLGMRIKGNLMEKLQAVEKAFGALAYTTIEETEKIFERYQELYGSELPFTYFINLIFGGPKKSSFEYQGLIQNVPLTRIKEITCKSIELSRKVAGLFRENSEKWSISLNEIYKIFPLRRFISDQKVKLEWRPFLELLNAILVGTPFPKDEVVKRALLYARIQKYGAYGGHNLEEVDEKWRDMALCRGLLKFNILLTLLSDIGVINLIESPQFEHRLDEDMEKFVEMQRYQNWQQALFLLGVLVGRIGIEQYKMGDERKSILNKIDFEGMSVEKLKRLANYLLKGLKDYRILKENEKTYGQMKELLDKNLDRLSNPLDNAFYLLSGYAYTTLKAITLGGGENE
jgi:CRISPR-associated protein Csh1